MFRGIKKPIANETPQAEIDRVYELAVTGDMPSLWQVACWHAGRDPDAAQKDLEQARRCCDLIVQHTVDAKRGEPNFKYHVHALWQMDALDDRNPSRDYNPLRAKAAVKGDANCAIHTGQCFEEAKNEAEALRYYGLVDDPTSSWYHQAQASMGEIRLHSANAEIRDAKQAVAHFMNSAQHGGSLEELSECFKRGVGVTANLAKAQALQTLSYMSTDWGGMSYPPTPQYLDNLKLCFAGKEPIKKKIAIAAFAGRGMLEPAGRADVAATPPAAARGAAPAAPAAPGVTKSA